MAACEPGGETVSTEYITYSKNTGHDANCAWVQWVVDGKFYPNPGCTCCKMVPLPKRAWWRVMLERISRFLRL